MVVLRDVENRQPSDMPWVFPTGLSVHGKGQGAGVCRLWQALIKARACQRLVMAVLSAGIRRLDDVLYPLQQG